MGRQADSTAIAAAMLQRGRSIRAAVLADSTEAVQVHRAPAARSMAAEEEEPWVVTAAEASTVAVAAERRRVVAVVASTAAVVAVDPVPAAAVADTDRPAEIS